MNSSFRDFERYLRMFSPLDEHDIQLTSKQYISKVETYKVSPGFYTFEDLQEVLSTGFKNEIEMGKLPNHKYDKSNSIIIKSDNVILITTLFSSYEIKGLRFDKKSFFITILGFST